MRNNYLCQTLVMMLCLHLYSFSTAQTWNWRVSDPRFNLVKDSNDDLYAYRSYYDNTTGDPASFTIERLLGDGTSLWIKTITGNAEIKAAQVNAANDLVVIGNLMDTVMIDAYTLSPNGAISFFIARISPAGTVLSANVYGNSNSTFANDIFITSAGDYLIGGGHTGSFTVNGHVVPGETYQNLFILKMDNSGNVLWSEASTMYTMSGDAMIDEVIETASGKYYATLTMAGGLVEFNGYQFTSSGQFMVMMDSNRQIQWEDYLGYPGITFNTTTDIQAIGDTAYMKEAHCHQGCYSSIYRWPASLSKDTMRWDNVSNLGYAAANGKIYYAVQGSDDANNPTFYYRKIGSLTAELSEQGEPADSAVTTDGAYTDLEFITPNSFYISGYGDGMNGFFIGEYNMSLAVGIAGKDAQALAAYPNPAMDKLYITGISADVYEARIFNLQGTLMYTGSVRPGEAMDVSSLSPSCYFVELVRDQSRSRIVFIKQ